MSRKPTGHVRGKELILTRTFSASIEDVWTSVTDSESTARWIGRWEGDAGPGKTVRLQMLHEKDQPWMNVAIESCEPPRRLVVRTQDDSGDWRLELTLTQSGETTELRFVHHLSDRKLAGDAGPGWEYYPAQKAHYLEGT
ncbi:MAG TPA: SRPBCC family protein [Polyangiaceae bacterium]